MRTETVAADAVSNEANSQVLQANEQCPRWLLEAALAGAGLALFVALLYSRLLFTNRVLASGDILHYFYPYRDFAAAALREGRIPLWNPYIFMGVPFLANPQAAALYPLHWPLSWLTVTKQIAWSAALHTWLLGLGGYLLMRRWRTSRWAAAATAVVLSGSGFYGGLIGHINQMNGAAWLPWAVLTLDAPAVVKDAAWRQRILSPGIMVRAALFGLLTALMFLAGHMQTVYINLFGLGVWVIWPLVTSLWPPSGLSGLRYGWRESAPRLFIYAAGGVLALLLSGAQLLPTLELSALGLRSGGLSYAEASSFSLKPLHLPLTLAPTYGLVDLGVAFDTLGYTEYVAYMGLLGLALAAAGAWRGRGAARQFGLLMVVLGLLLALGRWNPFYFVLYKLVPGFDLFRAPARWMMLYTLGMATLAGLGTDVALSSFRKRWQRTEGVRLNIAAAAILVLLAAELLLAARSLPHTHPTAPQAVYDLRTAPAHLLTDATHSSLGLGGAGRFLSMSNIAFDPGDMADYRRIFLDEEPAQIDEAAFNELIVALKSQEILAPNLALLWRIPSVDGFDGGVLPLGAYLDMLELFAPAEELVRDGRLREQLTEVPAADLLGLMNVQYVITDKVRDLWFEDVYYDRQIGARLGGEGVKEVTVEAPYAFDSTHVDVIGYVDEVNDDWAVDGAVEAATISAWHDDALIGEWTITAGNIASVTGAHFADGALDSEIAETSGAVVAYRDVEGGRQEYRARLALPKPGAPEHIVIRRSGDVDVVIQAVTLYDERTGMFLALTPSDRGRFQRVHSGDVKVYENLDAAPRAYLAHRVIPAENRAEALETVRMLLDAGESSVQDAAVVVGGPALESPASATDVVELVEYRDSEVRVRTSSDADGLLVLSDVHYPGWRAFVDGDEAPIVETNGLFRGVYLPAGEHETTFRFKPESWRRGLALSGLGFAIFVVMLGAAALGFVRKHEYPSV